MKKIPILLIGIIAVSTASIFIRMAQAEVSSIVIAAYRLSIAVILLAPFSIKACIHDLSKVDKIQVGLMVLSGILLALHFITWITSLALTSVTSSVVLVTTTPIWVAILTPLFLKESIRKSIVLGIVLTLLGGTIIGLGEPFFSSTVHIQTGLSGLFKLNNTTGNILALSGALFASGYIIIGKIVRKNISIMTYTFFVYGCAAIVLMLCVLFTGEALTGYHRDSYIWLILIALIPQVIGHSIFNWALKYMSAAFVSIVLIGEPVGTILLAMIFLNEYPSKIELVGGILIIAGIFIAAVNEQQKINKPILT